MLILPEQRVIVVATPRTGSRSVKEAIVQARPKGLIVTKPHHDFPHEVSRAASGGYDVYTIIRNPWDQLKSWLNHTQHWHDQERFVREHRSRYFFYAGGMNIYNEVATQYFVFENDGHRALLDSLGIEEEVPVIGKSKDPEVYKKELSEESIRIAGNRFANDFELYKQQTRR